MIARRPSTRPGFTLVEVLVAAALCILIMTILSYAFSQGLESMRQLKAIGDLQVQLRAVETILRDDLKADHLESDYGPRVSDQRMDLFHPTDNPMAWKPPRGGFFRIIQGNDPATSSHFVDEGPDQEGIHSTRATHHILQMTVKRPTDKPERMFRALVPDATSLSSVSLSGLRNGNELVSQWAEVTYFLDTTIQPPTQTPGGVNVYPLVRRVRVLATGSNAVSWGANRTNFQDVSYSPLASTTTPASTVGDYLVNGPQEIANPHNRLGGIRSSRTVVAPMTQTSEVLRKQMDTNGNPLGSDLLLTNVISFEIRAALDAGAITTTTPTTFSSNSDAPFDFLPPGANNSIFSSDSERIFDTWWQDPTPGNQDKWKTQGDADAVPNFIRLRAVQIKLRVWDSKTQMARQITIVQDI